MMKPAEADCEARHGVSHHHRGRTPLSQRLYRRCLFRVIPSISSDSTTRHLELLVCIAGHTPVEHHGNAVDPFAMFHGDSNNAKPMYHRELKVGMASSYEVVQWVTGNGNNMDCIQSIVPSLRDMDSSNNE